MLLIHDKIKTVKREKRGVGGGSSSVVGLVEEGEGSGGKDS